MKKRNLLLPVSAPFHCSLMEPAAKKMKKIINTISFKEPKINLIANVTAEEVNNTLEIKNLLVKQIVSKVRWRESVLNMVGKGVNEFIEIGPGKVLSGLVRRINKEIKVTSINSEEDIKKIKILMI